MPEEIEVPTEHIHEAAEHALHGGHGGAHSEVETGWIPWAALSAAILAVFAAVSALIAGHHANEAILEQSRASDGYSYYQAKGIKAALLGSKIEILAAMEKSVDPADRSTIERYKKEQEEIKAEADMETASSRAHMARHGIVARGVTLFQIAIALAATSMLTKKRPLWLVSMLLGVVGGAFLVQSLL